jgi:hypothetical protein
MSLETIVWSVFAFIVGWAIGVLMNPWKVQYIYVPIDEMKDMKRILDEREKDKNPYRTPES